MKKLWRAEIDEAKELNQLYFRVENTCEFCHDVDCYGAPIWEQFYGMLLKCGCVCTACQRRLGIECK